MTGSSIDVGIKSIEIKQFGVVGGKLVHCSPADFYKAVLRYKQTTAAKQQAEKGEGSDNASSNT